MSDEVNFNSGEKTLGEEEKNSFKNISLIKPSTDSRIKNDEFLAQSKEHFERIKKNVEDS